MAGRARPGASGLHLQDVLAIAHEQAVPAEHFLRSQTWLIYPASPRPMLQWGQGGSSYLLELIYARGKTPSTHAQCSCLQTTYQLWLQSVHEVMHGNREEAGWQGASRARSGTRSRMCGGPGSSGGTGGTSCPPPCRRCGCHLDRTRP
jgi:hypothetical protein